MYQYGSESSVRRILADSNSNRLKIGVFVSLIIVIIGCYIISIFTTPNTFKDILENDKCGTEKDRSTIYCSRVPSNNTWMGTLFNLKNTNSLINFWISINLKNSALISNHGEDDITLRLPFNYSITGVSGSGYSQSSNVSIRCNKKYMICGDSMLFFQTSVTDSSYKYEIKFTPDNSVASSISTIDVNIYTLNHKYTSFMIALRYSLLTISILFYLFYIYKYQKTEGSKRSYEQKLILVLGIFLIMFNDPIFAASIITVKPYYCAISIVFVCAFLGYLVVFWNLTILKIKDLAFSFVKGNNSILRIIPGFLIFALTVASGLISLYYTIYQPAIDNNLEVPVRLVVIVVLTVIIAMLLLVGLIWALIKIGKMSKKIPNRYHLFIIISIYFMVISFIFCIFIFYNPFDQEGGKLTLIFLLFNFYVWYLMLLWSLSDFWDTNPEIQISEAQVNNNGEIISANSSSLEPRVKDPNYNNSYHLDQDKEKMGFSENTTNNFSGNINFHRLNPRIDPLNFEYMDKELGVVQEEESIIKSDITGHGYELFEDVDNHEFKLKFDDSMDKGSKPPNH